MAQFDLTRLLPKRYQDKALNGLIKNLFNRHLSKDESEVLFGFIGDKPADIVTDQDIYITERDVERQVNQLLQAVYVKHAAEEEVHTWSDLIQRWVLMGVPYDSISTWLRTVSHNFMPPIDLDKFCNYGEYVWIYPWMQAHPELDYSSLGFPDPLVVLAELAASNPTGARDYYVIQRGVVTAGVAVAPYPGVTTWSPWALCNMWVHRDDAEAFYLLHTDVLDRADLEQAKRPIIEYFYTLRVNRLVSAGAPAETGTSSNQLKLKANQPPQFDIYHDDGTHTRLTSSIFYYKESTDQPVDPELDRRIVIDPVSADYVFNHGLTHPVSKRLLWFKERRGATFSLRTIWRGSEVTSASYIGIDATGTLVNQDKLENYQNYYWTGPRVPVVDRPAYNPSAIPQYYVLEQGGTSTWSTGNYWARASDLTSAELISFPRAQRPIIEFNTEMESELLGPQTVIDQLPKFRIYRYEQSSSSYVQLPIGTDTDLYTQGHLLARLDDLPEVKQAILSTPNAVNKLISIAGELYVQTLVGGSYVTSRGATTYAPYIRQYERIAIGDGQVQQLAVSSNATMQALTLTATSPTTFSVSSTVAGSLPALTVGASYTTFGATFQVQAGVTPFAVGDVLRIEVRTVAFDNKQFFAKLGSTFRSFTAPTGIVTNDVGATLLIPQVPTARTGAWLPPSAYTDNIGALNGADLGQGDLISHMSTIIDAQPGLIGSSTGANNWRDLPTRDLGLGGMIKQHSSRLPLLIGLTLQKGIALPGLVDFSSNAYSAALNKITEFVEERLLDLAVNSSALLPNSTMPVDAETYLELKRYIEGTEDDDGLNVLRPYYDTTMPVKALTLTAPYLGLRPLVAPVIELDGDQNINVITHHDGHRTPVAVVDDSVLRRLVSKQFRRSNGELSGGYVGGPTAPSARPFKQQLWLDLSTMTLRVYDVVSDTGELPTTAVANAYSYDRTTNTVYQYVSGSWSVFAGSVTAPWRVADFSLAVNQLTLMFEQELYDGCPPLAPRLNYSALEARPEFAGLMQKELERFASKHGITNPYGSNFDPVNPFTWNYSSVYPTAGAWNQVYAQVYGTSRPDLEPWLSCNYATEAAFLAAAITAGALPSGTTNFVPSTMWTLVAMFVRNRLGVLGKPTTLSVNVATGELLSPYAFGEVEQLLSTVPASASNTYAYGIQGPVELVWRRSEDYIAALLKTYMRLDPLTFFKACWGDELVTVNDYELLAQTGLKPRIGDVQLHGDLTVSGLQTSNVIVTSAIPTVLPRTYTIEVVSANQGKVRVSSPEMIGFVYGNVGTAFVADTLNITVTRPLTGLLIGETATVVQDGTTVTVTLNNGTVRKLEGYGQVYVHAQRAAKVDTSYAFDLSRLRLWEPKLAYRTATLLDTDLLEVRLGSEKLDKAAYRVLLDEVEFFNSSSLTGLSITLAQRGSTEQAGGLRVPALGSSGRRGDDWVFKVDTYNSAKPEIEWYELDEVNGLTTFFALSSEHSKDAWYRPNVKVQLHKARGPFIITGIQAVASFIFGYALRAREKGFVIDDATEPRFDGKTNRPVSWQLDVEKFIDQQFSGVDTGAVYNVVPFSKQLEFETPYGFMASLGFDGFLDDTMLRPALFNTAGKRLAKQTYRVFRDGPRTTINVDEQLAAATLLTSFYEHVILFEPYFGDNILIFDSFLGQRVSRLFLAGERHASPNGRIEYGGKFLLGSELKRNMEASVSRLLKLYDSTSGNIGAPDLERARDLLGFDSKDYFADRTASEQTEFRFWQGSIKAKGTNAAVRAYINSRSYQTAALDEYWAYKLAEYGDARPLTDVELKVEPDDCTTERSNYLFLESDELSLLGDLSVSNGYDMLPYETYAYGSYSPYSNEQALTIEPFDARGMLIVRPDDEARWYRYSDLRTLSYFQADVLAIVDLNVSDIDRPYELRGSDGKLVKADTFEVVDVTAIEGADLYDALPYDTAPYEATINQIYREPGDLIPGSNPVAYTPPRFARLNASTIKILDPILLDRPLKVYCYGPPIKKFSPNKLLAYNGNDVTVKDDLVWWDPARGSHHPQAHALVDYQLSRDPAAYNVARRRALTSTAATNKPWGELQVGKVWWNTKLLDWLPYHDSKLNTDMHGRVARWGSLADYSSIELYEWVEATLPPSEYDTLVEAGTATGEPAIKDQLYRDRTWSQRPVVWLTSPNPNSAPYTAAYYQGPTLSLELEGDEGLLIADDDAMPPFKIDLRLAAAIYSDPAREPEHLVRPQGLLKFLSEQTEVVVGSSTEKLLPIFAPSSYFGSFSIEVDDALTSYLTDQRGPLILNSEVEDGIYYIRATLSVTGRTQRIEAPDSPVLQNTQIEVTFDQLGVRVKCVALYGHLDSWPGYGVPSETLRKQVLVGNIGNPFHDIYLRESLKVKIEVDFGITTMPGSSSTGLIGWVAWKDPQDLDLDAPAPFNKYKAVLGSVSSVGSFLPNIADEIKARTRTPWLVNGVEVQRFIANYTPWKTLEPRVVSAMYYTTPIRPSEVALRDLLMTDVIAVDLEARGKIYINNSRYKGAFQVTYDELRNGSYVIIPEAALKQGDKLTVILEPYQPSTQELETDLTLPDADPFLLREYSIDYPYVITQERTAEGRIGKTKYFYWVKLKESPRAGGNLSVRAGAQLLGKHDSVYSVPQIMKFYNQLDGRPNRYAVLSVNGLKPQVAKTGAYKLRLTRNPTLRNDSENLKLKNRHVEWQLIRPNQGSRIPQALWDKLVDTLCGTTAVGQSLPFVPLHEYDQRNKIKASYGLGEGQVLTDVEVARETVINTLINTRVTKFDTLTGTLVPDPIELPGFDIAAVRSNFESPETIRAFMAQVWSSAKPKQVNELFFAVLDDTLVKTSELSGLFKTSFLSLNEVRTVDSTKVGV